MRMIRLLLAFIFTISIPCKVYAFDPAGWYIAEKPTTNFPTFLKITNSHFSGLPYKIINNENDLIEISITNSKKTTTIEKKENGVSITTVRGKNIFYRLLTHDISLTEKEVSKMGQIEK